LGEEGVGLGIAFKSVIGAVNRAWASADAEEEAQVDGVGHWARQFFGRKRRGWGRKRGCADLGNEVP